MSFWAVVQSNPMCEKRALWYLDMQGFTTYAPKEKITRWRRGKKIQTARWIFSRYLFVWVEEHWQRWFNTVGVTTVLMSGQQPAQLPNGWVENMKSQERNGMIQLPSRKFFNKGQAVQVIGGLFIGAHGLYQGQTSRQREVVLLDALGRVELASGLLR